MGYHDEKPNRFNVELGDYLLSRDEKGIVFLTITEVREYSVLGRLGNLAENQEYNRAVIKKQDGTWLVGEDVPGQEKQGEGGR